MNIFQAVNVLRQGGVVAFPTETSYGLAVDPYNLRALQKLYDLKKRDNSKPLLILIDHLSQLKNCVTNIPVLYNYLIEEYWPGPLTLIFPASKELPHLLTGGSNTVAVRQSPHPVASLLVKFSGIPITATSANLSHQPPALCGKECKEIFGDQIDYIIDNGEIGQNTFSTIVGLDGNKLVILRSGQLDLSTRIAELNQKSA